MDDVLRVVCAIGVVDDAAALVLADLILLVGHAESAGVLRSHSLAVLGSHSLRMTE